MGVCDVSYELLYRDDIERPSSRQRRQCQVNDVGSRHLRLVPSMTALILLAWCVGIVWAEATRPKGAR